MHNNTPQAILDKQLLDVARKYAETDLLLPKLEELLKKGADPNACCYLPKPEENLNKADCSEYTYLGGIIRNAGTRASAVYDLFEKNGFDAARLGCYLLADFFPGIPSPDYSDPLYITRKILKSPNCVPEKHWECVLDSFGTEGSYQHVCMKDHWTGGIYDAFCMMLEAASKHEDPLVFDYAGKIVGQKISSISVKGKPVLENNNRLICDNCRIYFHCNKNTLYTNRRDIMIDDRRPVKIFASKSFDCLLNDYAAGETILSIKADNLEVCDTGKELEYNLAAYTIKLTNNKYIAIDADESIQFTRITAGGHLHHDSCDMIEGLLRQHKLAAPGC